ncbi:MAG: beta-ketoacyl-[acyl-carrier-protein] synthase family protein [Variovorax paradoxus]|uniref:Nodulation protein E n=1 Tax=Variovorax paradoxus TaxID=34073 RepID=A0A2W5QB55_VARPD|nr:MAG: beta-ketoacyl-[acyl-carrier-protein] synthase family protein [Variovorax paradoxus]
MTGAPVAITGLGAVTPLGASVRALHDTLSDNLCAVAAREVVIEGVERFTFGAAACTGFEERQVRGPSGVALDRGTALALTAAREAAAQAGLTGDARPVEPERLGVYWGAGMGGASSFDQSTEQLYARHRRLRPTTVLTTMPNAAAAELSMAFGARAASMGYACACASSAVAIGEAMRAIRAGWVDIAVVGGHEALLSPGVIASWQAMKVLAPANGEPRTVCRPFAHDRAGFALGEGAAALVIESLDSARRRGAPLLALLSGYGTSCDAAHISTPDSAGQVRAMKAALADAGLVPGDIGHVNAHGTGTLAGDLAEAGSLAEVFGTRGVPVSATKALHGHLMGAGGAVELVCALHAMQAARLPACAGAPAEALGIDLVHGQSPRAVPPQRHVMSNSFAFGGTNAVLIASRLA